MKKNNFRVIYCIPAIFLFSFVFNSHVQAVSNKTPIIVIKKILAQPSKVNHESTQPISIAHTKKPALKPKSDISNISSINDKDDLFAALSNSIDRSPLPYDPTGKIDPFEPLIHEKPEIKDPKLTPVDSDRANKTQLEKIDLSQLRLSGILISK